MTFCDTALFLSMAVIERLRTLTERRCLATVRAKFKMNMPVCQCARHAPYNRDIRVENKFSR